MAAPTLFFCVGATKAGTSWLHEALSDHPECRFRSIKELHYFDALEHGRITAQVSQITARRDVLMARIDGAPVLKAAELSVRVQDRNDWLSVLAKGEDIDAYLAYVMAGAGDARVVGDVTPAYALLPEQRLQQMAGLSGDVRFLYLLRDPVARLWSHVRMMAARRGPDGKVDPQRAQNILNRTLRGDEHEIEIRGDYAAALTRLRTAIPSDRLLCVYYEDLFDGDGMAQICDFLSINRISGDGARRVHAGAVLDMPAPLREKAGAWLVPQYEFVARTLGRLPLAWQANMQGV